MDAFKVNYIAIIIPFQFTSFSILLCGPVFFSLIGLDRYIYILSYTDISFVD